MIGGKSSRFRISAKVLKLLDITIKADGQDQRLFRWRAVCDMPGQVRNRRAYRLRAISARITRTAARNWEAGRS